METDEVEGGNEAIKLVSNLELTKYARLFVAPLKTFEYDLAMCGNCALMAEVIKEGWPRGNEDIGVKSKCQEIVDRSNEYEDDNCKRNDAIYIYEHIDSNELGKGAFSQLLLEKIEQGKEIIVPDYIKNAIVWAAGGDLDEGEISARDSKNSLQ